MKRKRFPAEQIVSILRQAELGMSVSDIVRQLGISEQTFYRWKKQYAEYLHSRKDPKLPLRQRLKELAQVRLRWGYRRLHVLLKREGFKLGVNQTYRWYRLEELQLRSWRKKRSKTTMPRQARMQPLRVNDAWSMDFVADQLADGTKIRLLTIIDIHSRESLAIVVGHRLRGEDVVVALNHIVSRRPAPKCLFVDNGSEFSGQLLDLWAYRNQTPAAFTREVGLEEL